MNNPNYFAFRRELLVEHKQLNNTFALFTDDLRIGVWVCMYKALWGKNSREIKEITKRQSIPGEAPVSELEYYNKFRNAVLESISVHRMTDIDSILYFAARESKKQLMSAKFLRNN